MQAASAVTYADRSRLIWKFYDALILQSAIPFAEAVLSCLLDSMHSTLPVQRNVTLLDLDVV